MLELCAIQDTQIELILIWYDLILNCTLVQNNGTTSLEAADLCLAGCQNASISISGSSPIEKSISCNTSNIDMYTMMATTEYDHEYEYGMELIYDSSFPLEPTKLFVIDRFANRYETDTLCGPVQYGVLWPDAVKDEFVKSCDDSNSYKYLYLATEDHPIHNISSVSLLIQLVDPDFLYKKKIGLISPPSVVSWQLDANGYKPTSTMYLDLYWYTYFYKCVIEAGQQLICDISNTNKTVFDPKSAFNMTYVIGLRFIRNGDNFSINAVHVTDENNQTYHINSFCIRDIYIYESQRFLYRS